MNSVQENATPSAESQPKPIDMVLHCPKCGLQHIDAPEPDEFIRDRDGTLLRHEAGWTNEPHRSHLCHGCGHIWRPADVPTNGVQAVKTKGKADSPIATPQPAVTAGAVDARITAIEQAIRDYHYALDTRQHGGVAQDRAVNAICNAMGMHWTQGAEAARRALAAQRGGA